MAISAKVRAFCGEGKTSENTVYVLNKYIFGFITSICMFFTFRNPLHLCAQYLEGSFIKD